MSKKGVTRRQFLNYTLTGVGGFMASATLLPMLRFAADPLLQTKQESDFVVTDKKISEITSEPVRVDFAYEQTDGWYSSTVTNTAWVYKNEKGEIVALSPVCTHLGCMVDWNTNEKYPNKFYCPCHDGLYTKDGKNVEGTPPTRPLDVYTHKEVDGYLALGKVKPREEA